MHTAVNDRAKALHKIAMQRPHGGTALLIEIHSHNERLAQCLRYLDETLPGGMMPQDISNNKFLSRLVCGLYDPFSSFDRIGQGLFDEHMASIFKSFDRHRFMCIRPCRDGYGIRSRFG